MLEKLVVLAENAGRLVMRCDRSVTLKEDGTELTPADVQSHEFLVKGLHALFGADIKILSEEGAAAPPDTSKGITIVIDPLDGTTNFKNGKRNYSVLLSVLEDGKPVFGVAVAPAYGVTACGGSLMKGSELRLHNKNGGGYRQVRKLEAMASSPSDIAVVPRRFIESTNEQEREIIGKAMSAFQTNAGIPAFEGTGQILGSMMPVFKQNIRCRLYEAVRPNQRPGDWDLAAWDAILRGAGGIMTYADGKEITYGAADRDFKHQNFICWRGQDEAAAYAAKIRAANQPRLIHPIMVSASPDVL